jgi:predicted ATPase/DNA-binding CsgD family transcriptional regulator
MVSVVDLDTTVISDREAEVLNAVGEHLTNAQIAQKLHISVRTVESHVSALLRKLGASDRRELASMSGMPPVWPPPGPELSPDLPQLVGLPATWTTFVGRAAELTDLSEALLSNRLVTLVGPGGVGKTRLAVVAASENAHGFACGGVFVDLVPVSPDFVLHAVAATLGVVERPQDPLQQVVHERLRAGPTLLVLDNCEHVLGAVVELVRSVLASCPEVVVLATSRERLGVAGERVVALSPLGVTTGTEGGDESDAAQLFTDRAGRADADPAVVAEICRRLGGMPLSIELAAARSSSLGLDGLLAGLDDHLRLLSRSSPTGDRHGSLRTVIEWSHQLLDDTERAAFRRLGVFVGAFDLSAATAIAGDGDTARASDLIGRLTDKSLLVHVRQATGSRWQMLDTVHAYAHEQLEVSGEADAVCGRHHAWATATARELEQSLDTAGWQERFDAVAGDLRSALRAPDAVASRTDAFDLALALGHLTYARRFLVESSDHFRTAVARAPDEASAVVALRTSANAAYAEMRGEAAFDLLQEAFARASAAGDNRMGAIVMADAATLAGRCPALFTLPLSHEKIMTLVDQAKGLAPEEDDLEVVARIAVATAWASPRGPTEPTVVQAREALDRTAAFGDPALISSALDAAGSAAGHDGHYKEAYRYLSERLQLLDRLPRHDPKVGGEIADIFHMASEAAVGAGHLEAALAGARNSYHDDTNQGLPQFAATHLLPPLVLRGEFDEAMEQAMVMHQGWERAGRPPAGWMSPAFFATALVLGLRGDEDASTKWVELGTSIAQTKGPFPCGSYFEARLALHRGALEQARLQSGSQVENGGGGYYQPYVQAVHVEAAVVAKSADAEELLAAAQPLTLENDFVAPQILRAAGRLHHDEAALKDSVAGWEVIGARFERACTLLLLSDRVEEGSAELAALRCTQPAPSWF